MQHLFKACVISGAALCPLAAQAQDFSFEGDVTLTARYFPDDGALDGQPGAGTSFFGATRLAASGGLSFGQFAVELRGDRDQSADLSSWDLSKAYIAGEIGTTQWLLGNDVVFWGVTKSLQSDQHHQPAQPPELR